MKPARPEQHTPVPTQALRTIPLRRFSWILLLSSFVGCSSGPDTVSKPGPKDGATDNGDGTTTITLGGVEFTTVHRDFSSEPVVSTPTTVSASLVDELDLGSPLVRFRIAQNTAIGFRRINSSQTELAAINLATGSDLSTHSPSFFVAGFDYNGAIMSVEGSEEINFYLVENGTIGDRFFHIPQFKNSAFVSECFMDEATAYLQVRDTLYSFPIYDSSDVTPVMTIQAFSEIRFAADESFLYVSVLALGGSGSHVTILDKSDYSVERTIDYPGREAFGISVDANYLYLSDRLANVVVVKNKHTGANVGTIPIPDTGAIEVRGGTLYSAGLADGKLREYSLTYADAP